MKKLLKDLLALIQYILAGAFMQIVGLIAIVTGGVAWAHFGSLWAAAAGFVLVVVLSMPIYGLLSGDIRPSRRR